MHIGIGAALLISIKRRSEKQNGATDGFKGNLEPKKRHQAKSP